MTDTHLVRTKAGRMVHLRGCSYAGWGKPWIWAEGRNYRHGGMMSQHNPTARYCVMFDRAIPIDDTVDCAACQENYDLAAIDPDFADEYRDYPRPEARSGNDGIPQPAERPRNPNNLT